MPLPLFSNQPSHNVFKPHHLPTYQPTQPPSTYSPCLLPTPDFPPAFHPHHFPRPEPLQQQSKIPPSLLSPVKMKTHALFLNAPKGVPPPPSLKHCRPIQPVPNSAPYHARVTGTTKSPHSSTQIHILRRNSFNSPSSSLPPLPHLPLLTPPPPPSQRRKASREEA